MNHTTKKMTMRKTTKKTDDDEEEEEAYQDPNKIQVVDIEDSKTIYQLVHGDSESLEEFEQRLENYTKDDWQTLAQSLLQRSD